MIRVQRTVPPTAPPLAWADVLHGLWGLLAGKAALKRLEGELREYLGAKHLFLVSSGRAALALILRALVPLSPRRQVIIPAYTCFSVPSAVVKAGLEVVLCDIDPGTLDFDLDLLEGAINEKTLCVVPGHLFGAPSELDRIRVLCERRGAFLVEDAAQALGGSYKGRKLGTIGDVGFFSLGRGKNITCGSGGIVVTGSDRVAVGIAREFCALEDPGLVEDLQSLFLLLVMTIFIHPSLYWLPASLPFLRLGETRFDRDFPMKRLSGMKACFLRSWRRLEAANRARVESAASWIGELGLSGTHRAGVAYLRLPVLQNSREERDRIAALSKQRGLGVSLVYPTPISEIEEIRAAFAGESFPAAAMVAERLLALPTHHLLSGKDKRRIVGLFDGGADREEMRPAARSGKASRGVPGTASGRGFKGSCLR